MGKLEGGSSGWKGVRERKLKEGFMEGPREGQPAAEYDPRTQLNIEGDRAAKTMSSAEKPPRKFREIEGFITDKPFNANKIRSREWYSIYAVRAANMLRSYNNGRKITLDFEGPTKEQIISALQVISRLPLTLHENLTKNGPPKISTLSSREYDAAAKKLLNGLGVDIWGETGILQIILAYWRGYRKLKDKSEKNRDINFVLKFRESHGRKTKSAKPKRRISTITNKEVESYDPYKGLPKGTVRIERSDRNRR